MLTEHDLARPKFSISYLPLLKLCADLLHRRDIDLTVIFKSGRILSSSFRCATLNLSIPIPFIMPNRLISAPYLALLSNYAIHAYLIYITHVPYIMMAVHQTPFNRSCVFFKFSYIENIFQFSIKFTDTLTCSYLPPGITCTIIFTFSIIPHLILFVKHYFRNQHPDCNTSRK